MTRMIKAILPCEAVSQLTRSLKQPLPPSRQSGICIVHSSEMNSSDSQNALEGLRHQRVPATAFFLLFLFSNHFRAKSCCTSTEFKVGQLLPRDNILNCSIPVRSKALSEIVWWFLRHE